MWAGKICEKTRRSHVRPESKSVLIILSLILFVIILASNFEGADAGRRGGGGSWGRGSRYIFKTYLIWMPIIHKSWDCFLIHLFYNFSRGKGSSGGGLFSGWFGGSKKKTVNSNPQSSYPKQQYKPKTNTG